MSCGSQNSIHNTAPFVRMVIKPIRQNNVVNEVYIYSCSHHHAIIKLDQIVYQNIVSHNCFHQVDHAMNEYNSVCGQIDMINKNTSVIKHHHLLMSVYYIFTLLYRVSEKAYSARFYFCTGIF